MILALLASTAFSAFAKEGPKEQSCFEKVTSHYKKKYSSSISSSFKLNFTERKSRFYHAFAYPELAFLAMATEDENYIAARMNQEAKKDCGAKDDREVYEKYVELLKSGKLCEDLEQKGQRAYWKEARTLRIYILDEVAAANDKKQ